MARKKKRNGDSFFKGDQNSDLDPIALFKKEAFVDEILSKEQELELGRRAKEGDIDARDKLIRHNYRFAFAQARKNVDKGLPLTDLVQAANIGLIEAANRFDPNKGVRFISYAVHWIHQSIQQELARTSRTIRLSQTALSVGLEIRRIEKKIEQNGGITTNKEIAARLGKSVERVREVRDGIEANNILSLDRPIKDSKGEATKTDFSDYVPSQEFLYPELSVLAREEFELACKRVRSMLNIVLKAFNVRSVAIMVAYYGLDGSFEKMTLEDIGSYCGITRERVRQVKLKVWEKLAEIGFGLTEESFLLELDRIQILENAANRAAEFGLREIFKGDPIVMLKGGEWKASAPSQLAKVS